jgi:vancomycin resistance protein YoaR
MSAITHPPSSIKSRSTLEQIAVAMALGFGIFLVAIVAIYAAFQIWYAGRIFPGVQVSGVDVGGLTPASAAARITQEFSYPQSGKILLQDGGQSWLVSPGQLGLYLDPETSALNAYRIGRSGGMFRRLRNQYSAYAAGEQVPPALIFDQRVTYLVLEGLGKQIDKPVVEATLQVQGMDVLVQAGQTGRELDLAASLALVSAQVQTLQDGIVPLVVRETPPAILDASAQAEVARKILSAPLTISVPEGETGGPWTIEPDRLAGMLTFQRVVNGQSAEYRVGLDAGQLLAFLTGLAPDLQRYPQNARFIFNDDTRELEVIQNAVIGRALDAAASLTAVQERVAAGEHNAQLVFDYTNPAVTDDKTGADLGITELVVAETSYYYGSSPDRVQNIQAAAASFHGLLIAPGETFSMASQLTDISLENGYAEAAIIVGGRTVKGVGGGVCQVSTTLFRAAFFGGFPVVERHAHAYRVYYYEKVAGNRINTDLAGLDATVYVPLVDFKFTNDTPYWLLMETYVNPSSASITWKFYSTQDGRTVDWTTTGPINRTPPPEPQYIENPDLAEGEINQVDWEAEGADVNVTRTVYRNGAVYFQDYFNTHYQPWRAVYEYGPGTEIPDEEN